MLRTLSRRYATGSPKTAKSPNGLFAIVAWMVSPSSEVTFVQRPSELVTTFTIVPGAKRSGQSSGSSPVVITKSSGFNTMSLLMPFMCTERLIWVPAGTGIAAAAHMMIMPKKTKKPAPVRPELIAPLTEILRDRGERIPDWPADEAAAYRNSGRFQEGRDAVHRVRMAKAAAAIEKVFADAIKAAELKSYLEGISAAQAMTGFSDETFRSILDKDGLTAIDLDGSPIS
jgi:hypothetical protein